MITTSVVPGDSTPTTAGGAETNPTVAPAPGTPTTKAPAGPSGPNNTAAPNQVQSAPGQTWTLAVGGTDGSVRMVTSDGTKATTLVSGGSGLDPAPAWSPDRSRIAYVTRDGASTGIAFASVAQGSGPGNALPRLPCQTCGWDPPDPPVNTVPPHPTTTHPPTTTTTTTKATVTTPTTASTTTTTTVKAAGTTVGTAGTTASTTIEHPIFVGPTTIAWAEQSCTGPQCVTSVVFGDTTLNEQSRVRIPGDVTMMAPGPTGQQVLAVANDRLVVVRPDAAAADDGGPYTGVSVDHRGHTIGWHSDRPGQASVLEDVQDHHTIEMGQAGAVTSLAWSPDGAQVSYVSSGRLFVANADFSGPRDVTPNGMTVASVA